MEESVTYQWILPGKPLGCCADIRREVFMDEQGFQNEFDGTDSIAHHLCLYVDGIPAATGRVYPGEKPSEYIIGRVAVRKGYRGKGIGAVLVTALEQRCWDLGAKQVSLDAQERVKGFYASLGYQETGDIHFDEFCPHVLMVKKAHRS